MIHHRPDNLAMFDISYTSHHVFLSGEKVIVKLVCCDATLTSALIDIATEIKVVACA